MHLVMRGWQQAWLIWRSCCGGAGAIVLAAAGQLLALVCWPQRYAAYRESLASAEMLACLACMLLLRLPGGASLPGLLPEGSLGWSVLGCAVVQYFWLARPLRLRTALALLPPQIILLATAAALPSLECPSSGCSALPALQVRPLQIDLHMLAMLVSLLLPMLALL